VTSHRCQRCKPFEIDVLKPRARASLPFITAHSRAADSQFFNEPITIRNTRAAVELPSTAKTTTSDSTSDSTTAV
jgi:hypothetical protein